MKIRSLFSKILFCLAVLTAGHQARAIPIASYTQTYVGFTGLALPLRFTYGVSDNIPTMDPWDTTLLTIYPFANSVWGSTYILNAGNTASFAAFTAALTDGEEDSLGHHIENAGGGSSAYSTEAWTIFGAPTGPFGADLIGYDISEITIHFEEDDFWDFLNPQAQGKYTVSFSGNLSSVPEIGSTLGLLAVALSMLYVSHRRGRQA